MDAIDAWPTRRCFTTQMPPSAFPCRNLHELRRKSEEVAAQVLTESSHQLDAVSSLDLPFPCIGVFIADPRFMLMRHFDVFARSQTELGIVNYLEALFGVSNEVLWFQPVHNALDWAKVADDCPQHVRLLFLEDFVLQPDMAVEGLVHFLGVPKVSTTTEDVKRQTERLLSSPDSGSNTGTVKQFVEEFEKGLAASSQDVQLGWERFLQQWLHSPNPRMSSMAICALRHEPWIFPKWWIAHSARLCRACIFYPRGACRNDECDWCHAPGHPAKTKRPAKGKRALKQRHARTPSPEPR